MQQGYVFARSSGHVNSRQKTACLRHDSAFLADTAVINNVSRVLISNVRSARWCHMQLVISVFFIDKKKPPENKLHTEQSRHTYESNGCLIIKYICQLTEIIDIIYN